MKKQSYLTGKLLDVGCGSKPYLEELKNIEEYVGLEYESDVAKQQTKADFFYDGKTFPFEDNFFDSALSTQVLEHVSNPQEIVYEISRVLKKGGYVMLSAPFSQEEHETPFDFYRFSPQAICQIFADAGLEIVYYRRLTVGIKAVISTLTFYIYRLNYDKKFGKIVINILSTVFNLIGILLSCLLKRDGGIYINNFILARKI